MNRGLVLVLIAATLVATRVRAEEAVVVGATPTAPHRRTITVIGVGRERGAPDTVELRIAVEQTAPTAKAASEQAAKSTTQVVQALKNEVGPNGRVDTASYQLTPSYRNDPHAPARDRGPEIVGYVASNYLAVLTHRLDAVGTLIDTAIAAGAARVDSLAFTLADPAPLQQKALRGAGADAAAQAAAIAESLRVTLRGVIDATTESVERPIPQRFGMAMMRTAADAEMAPTPIQAGEVTAEARLRVTYGID